MPAHCSHCQLPVGRFGLRREIAGEEHDFCCYGCCLAFQVRRGEREEPEAAALLIRLGVGAFLAMNIMLFSLLQYSGSLGGDDAWFGVVVDWLLWLLATPVLAILGGPFVAGAWVAARDGRLNADALVCIGAGSAYGYSVWQVLRGSGVVYFDTATMVLLLFTLGRYLEAQARVQAARSLAPMLEAERAPARVVTAAGESQRPASQVQKGDLVRVLPGERLAVDGIVVDGESDCDESVLTGQSEARPKQPGAAVHAGSVNGQGPLLVRASVAGSSTQWVLAGRLVREALARKTMTGESVDRVAAWFVPFVLVLAVATGGYWVLRGDPAQALLAGLAVLVVACPCALGLAAPLANVLGIGEAAQRGILVRGGAVFEALAGVRAVAFDKTGTLTQGEFRLLALRADGASARQVLRRARALAAGSGHPAARAIAAGARGRRTHGALARKLFVQPGAGASGEVNGTPTAMGSAAFMTSLGWPMPEALAAAALPATCARVYVGWNARVRGVLAFADRPLAQAGPVIRALRERGLPGLLLSGDGEGAVSQVALELGIAQWRSALLPGDKVQVLRGWAARRGPVAMVGDGLNDGPVLACAAVGIAVGDATALARESADLTLPHDGLFLLPWVFDLARRVRRSVFVNLTWACGYNSIALGLAACGLLRPVLAAALMAGSSLLVVGRSLRAQRRSGPGRAGRPQTRQPPARADRAVEVAQ